MNFQNKNLLIVPQLIMDMNQQDVREVGCKMVLIMLSNSELPLNPNINTLLRMENVEVKNSKKDSMLAGGLK